MYTASMQRLLKRAVRVVAYGSAMILVGILSMVGRGERHSLGHAIQPQTAHADAVGCSSDGCAGDAGDAGAGDAGGCCEGGTATASSEGAANGEGSSDADGAGSCSGGGSDDAG